MNDPRDPHDPLERELEKAHPPPDVPVRTPPSLVPWILGVVLLVAIAGTAYFLLSRPGSDPRTAETPEAVDPSGTAAGGTAAPLGAPAEPVEVPPLEESDPVVRNLVRALSSHPRVVAWLTTDHLIRNFAVVVENIGSGVSPGTHLRVLRPADPFLVEESDDEILLDPRSYQRYAQIAAAVDSVQPNEAARLYTILKPRLEEAYRELGHTEPFDRALERAIVMLLETPVIEGPVRLEPHGAVLYQFQDPAFERLTPAQKQFARMGPQHVRAVKARLREIALALGIASERLPG